MRKRCEKAQQRDLKDLAGRAGIVANLQVRAKVFSVVNYAHSNMQCMYYLTCVRITVAMLPILFVLGSTSRALDFTCIVVCTSISDLDSLELSCP